MNLENLIESELNEAQWVVFIGGDDDLEDGEEARMLAYKLEDGEEDIISDMDDADAERFSSTVEEEDRDSKQVDVVKDGDDYTSDDNVMFLHTV